MPGSRGSGKAASGKGAAQRAGSLAVAHHLISEWASCELSEIRKNWHHPSSPGYRDWEPPRDPDTRLQRQTFTRNYAEIQLTGWVIFTLKERSRIAIRRRYIDGDKVGHHAMRMALDEFMRNYESWRFVWRPLDHL